MIRRLRDWWNDEVYIPLYCKLAMFQLLKHETTNEFIVIWWPHKADPDVSGFHIVVSLIFPWSWKRRVKNELGWDKLMRIPGARDMLLEACRAAKDSDPSP